MPFCAARCGYCDYPIVAGSLELAGGFVTAVLAETRALANALPERPLAAIYVGGGTPTWLPRPALRRLLAGLREIAASHGGGFAGPAAEHAAEYPAPAAAPDGEHLEPAAAHAGGWPGPAAGQLGSHAGATARPGGRHAGRAAAPPVEWTVEANPEDLDAELLDLCAAAGVNRLSVGVQAFDDEVLRRLQRRCHGRDLARRLDLVLQRWRGRLNLDLLVGIPGQTGPSVTAAVDHAAALGVSHVTLLQLTDPGPGGPQPAADADQLWLTGRDRLAAHGFDQYEVTHFGRAGDRSGYLCHTLQLGPVAAVGPAAAGMLPGEAAAALYPTAAAAPPPQGVPSQQGVQPQGVPAQGVPPQGASPEAAPPQGVPHRVTHTPQLVPYISAAGAGWGGRVEPLSPAELVADYLLQGLRLAAGLQVGVAEQWFAPSPGQLLAELWERWVAHGLAHPPGRRLALTARGLLQADRLAGQALECLATSPPIAHGPGAWPSPGA